ncbi:MAG: hypothetical protein WA765_15785 [Candidatus Acidiferrum sp.]
MANTCPQGQVSSNQVQVPFLTCFEALAIVQKSSFHGYLSGNQFFALLRCQKMIATSSDPREQQPAPWRNDYNDLIAVFARSRWLSSKRTAFLQTNFFHEMAVATA